MIVNRTSQATGKQHTMDIDVTPEQMQAWLDGELIQRAMPNLTPAEREFILTGTTQEEWDEMFKEEDDA